MPPLKKRTPSSHTNNSKCVHPAADRWNVVWETMAKQLMKYKKEHGDCRVPQRYAADPKLGRWVNKQRENKHTLSPERKKILDSMGFVWSVVHRESWQTMFEKLVAYKQQHGDTLVPQRYKDDPRLGGWVREQRKNKDNISQDRKNKLDSIGFAWRARGGPQEPVVSKRPSTPSKTYAPPRHYYSPMEARPHLARPSMSSRMPSLPAAPYQPLVYPFSPPETPPSPSNLILRQRLQRMIQIEEEREVKANLCILEILKRRRSSLAASQCPSMNLPYSSSSMLSTLPYLTSNRTATSRAMLNEFRQKSSILPSQGAK